MVTAVENIVVCRPTGNNAVSIPPCTYLSRTGQGPVIVRALVLDPATNLQNTVILVPFDYTHAASAFAFGLTMVITFWLIAKPIGLMIGLVKSS